jgi:FKBP-type peptidyl-prolyl cis-trans isomerase 2
VSASVQHSRSIRKYHLPIWATNSLNNLFCLLATPKWTRRLKFSASSVLRIPKTTNLLRRMIELSLTSEGTREGEPFDGGAAEDFPVVLGSGSLLPAFESNLEGMSAGESKTFSVTFPEDYQAKDLAGQVVQFEVKVKAVEVPQLPTLDGDFARSLGVPSGDVDALRADVKTNLEREVKKRLHMRVKNEVMGLLLESHSFDVPAALIDQESQRLAEGSYFQPCFTWHER